MDNNEKTIKANQILDEFKANSKNFPKLELTDFGYAFKIPKEGSLLDKKIKAIKMDVTKYYTPEISEFHVGFEFETNYLKKDWEKQILDIEDASWFYDAYKNDAVDVEFRVKFLDREDILECGFRYSGLAKSYFVDGSLTDVEHSGIWMSEGLNNHYWITDCRQERHQSIFIGTIKNKSELKRLMVQLGITEYKKD